MTSLGLFLSFRLTLESSSSMNTSAMGKFLGPPRRGCRANCETSMSLCVWYSLYVDASYTKKAMTPTPKTVSEATTQAAPLYKKLRIGDLAWGSGLPEMLREADSRVEGASVFGTLVNNPQDYGIVSFDAKGRPFERTKESEYATRTRHSNSPSSEVHCYVSGVAWQEACRRCIREPRGR